MRKGLTRGIFSFLCLAVLCVWNSGDARAFPDINRDDPFYCLDCHFPGSTIVPGSKQFEVGTSWHTFHMGEDPTCVVCHPGSPGNTPIPTENCTACHPNATCAWQDFHTSNQTYNDNVMGLTCAECHQQCAQPGGDADGDGIPDDQDNCPETPNPGQEDTLPPPDGNGIGDACDCEGDFTCNGNVDGGDVGLFLAHFGRSPFFNPCTNSDPCDGDFDCDVNVDGGDVAIFLEDFGRSQFFNPCPACVAGPWCQYP